MRVAIVRRAPRASFSMDVYADGLVSGLKAIRPDWEIIELTPNIPQNQTRTLQFSSLLNGLNKYHQRYWQYPQDLKKQKVDIFHVIDHSDGHLCRWLKKTGKPVVVTCHDLINFVQPENGHNRALIPAISMPVWKFSVEGICEADRIITVSEHTAKDVETILDIKFQKLTVVPNAVEGIFRPISQVEIDDFRTQYNISPETVCILNVGSNHPRKNVLTILKVLEKLIEKGLPVHFFKTGEQWTQELKTFIDDRNLNQNITYLGKPDKDTLVKIYNSADILLAPSLYEGFGMTILEAMSCGTPAIASNVSSLPEVAGDAAILVDPLNIQQIVEAVCRLHEEPELRQSLIDKGLARAKKFTWEKTAEQVTEIYANVVNKTIVET
ncbi:glycosyltransferase family 4 protein [Mastigocoleus testarum]|uniref:Glycosyl transferase group 1 n=1 Tax=Mastigocoleus testarum BC008 TaxID=371196 RepID=A0A0V7ZIE0_9CYAN|nr:glycosyltransferase family 1 protein [Mastigocoleus testarum]KST64269.1 glycosyl transferase group 1 [Mastigocoleus testarum BC008]